MEFAVIEDRHAAIRTHAVLPFVISQCGGMLHQYQSPGRRELTSGDDRWFIWRSGERSSLNVLKRLSRKSFGAYHNEQRQCSSVLFTDFRSVDSKQTSIKMLRFIFHIRMETSFRIATSSALRQTLNSYCQSSPLLFLSL